MASVILSLVLLGASEPKVEAQAERETLLYVTTSPPGAEVLVDGKQVGTTPGLFPFKPGLRRVIVDLDHHNQYKQDVTIRAGDIKRLKLRLKRHTKAKVDTLMLSPDARLDAILARLNKPPRGWEVLESKSESGDRLASAAKELGGRVDYVSIIGLSRRGKRIVVGVCHGMSGEELEGIRDEALRSAVGFSRLIGHKPRPLACLTYGNTILTFFAADDVAPEFLGEALRELGFAKKSQVPLWANLPKQHELRKQNRVKLVVGKERMTLEGKPTTWEELRDRLEELPDRQNTVLYIARTTDDWVISAWREVEDRIHGARRDLEFESTSFVGVHPLGSRAILSLRLVIAGKENMTFEGCKVNESELFDTLLKVPERYRTVLEIVRASGGSRRMTIQQWNNLHGHASSLALQLGFKGTTYTGERPLGSKSTTDEPVLVDRAPIIAHGVELEFANPNEALELIEQNYYVGLERPDLIEAAIRGMIEELDVHSDYISETELAALQEQVPEKLSGIGLALRFDQSTQELRVETPLTKMPAYRAGVRAGDTIVQIDGKPTSEFPQETQLQSAVTRIRGKPGTTVTIGLKRSGSDEVEQIQIVREAIRVPAIKGDARKPNGDWDFMLDDDRKIGYVRLMHFNSRCADELRGAVENLQSKGMMAFILDLRNNPGGTLAQAIQVADLFVEDGVIVSVKDRQEPGRTWFAKREGTLGEFPMAVLVNRDSVAAAEIVAACLQDRERAIIVGERTYGKGTAHRILELKDSAGALKLPTSLFLRPNGKGIHRFDGAEAMDTWGVVPDEECEVNLSTEEYARFVEYRRQRDVLRPGSPQKSDFLDRQLQKAIECLKTDDTAVGEPLRRADTKDQKDPEVK
jgi:carboxyl-terminal processing protease